MVERVLLVLNRSSGTGHGEEISNRLVACLREELPADAEVLVEGVSNHPSARARAQEFLRKSQKPAAIVVGGGGGTLRAVVEAISSDTPDGCLPGPERVRVATLRMGSGNIVAKQFSVPLNPLDGIRAIAANLRAGKTAAACTMRLRVGKPGGASATYFGMAMCGVGQFGRVPGMLARWHRHAPGFRRSMAKIARLETLNNFEYGCATLARSIASAIRPRSCEEVEVRVGESAHKGRLLAGVVLNFPVRMLPFGPGAAIGDEAIELYLVFSTSRLRNLAMGFAPKLLARHATAVQLRKGITAEIRYLNREKAEFFLDEDPEEAFGWLKVEVAGTLAFVPGLT